WTDWQPVEKLTLRRGQDFDEVILGIPVGALPSIASELVEASAAWKRMVTRVQTTATQAVQLWLAKPTDELGWKDGASILTAYEDALNTWADMSHLLPVEDWRGGPEPKSVAYFCGPLADPPEVPPFTDIGYPGRAREQVKADAVRWLELCNDYIYPVLRRADGTLDLDQLICDGSETPEDRWAGQYFRANVEPTERYVLSVPGSTTARLRADRSGFGNLWLAGDWTYTGINAGCVEGAVMSGMRAAAGLAGVPPDIVGEEVDPIPGGARVEPDSFAPVLKTYRPQNSPWPWSALYGMAETTGPCVTLAYPRDAVARMLPSGLALAPQALTGPDQHPVILLFGRQRDVRMNAMPRGMTSYLEFICAVPYVIHADPREGRTPPMIWPQKLYLDSDPPIGLGVWGYGFPKERASILLDDGSYIVRDRRTGREILSCTWTSKGARDRAFAFPQFSRVRAAYEMAMVTKRPLVGTWQYSVYDFSLDSALLEPVEMEVRVGVNAFGLPPGLVRPPSIAEAPLGAFFLTADGTINNPFQSREIRQRLREAGG
ncbi:MAG TPA: acetoacetate decarboxylase family protein, partial [Rubellimicrobium sp.]|nr:acetoacetate decarboxylase family protein [Rubellimicrobium sp.]